MPNSSKTYGKPKVSKKKRKSGHASRILLGAKITDYRLKKIIRCYADGLTAIDAAKNVNVSATRIYAIYKLIRRRMILLGVYPDALHVLADAKKGNAPNFRDMLIDRIELMKSERRGIRDSNFSQHAAEVAYRTLLGEKGAQHHYDDIMLAIRHAGPLNATKRPSSRYEDIRVLRHIAHTLPTLRRLAPKFPEARRYLDGLLELSRAIELKPGVHRHRELLPKTDSGQ